MNELPLRRLLLRESLLVVGLGGLGLTVVGWWGARAIMFAQAKARAEAGLRDVERRVKSSLEEAVRTGEALAQMGRLGQLAPMDSLAGEQQLLAELVSRPSLSNLTFVLPDGQASAANAPEVDYQFLWATRGTHVQKGESQRILHLWDGNRDLVRTGPDPAAPPDWRLRPWVIQGLQEGKGTWTPPYLFLGRVGFGLTYTIPVFREHRAIGVLGVDLVLGDIRPWLTEAKPTPGTRLSILDGDGRLLVPPDQEQDTATPDVSRILKPEALDPSRHPIPSAVHLTKDADRPGLWPETKIGGETYLVQRRRLLLKGGLDWELLAAIPERDLLDEPRKWALATLAMSLCALLFLAWRMARSSRKIAEPLERLAAQAERMVEGEPLTSPDTAIIEVQNLARTLRKASLSIRERSDLEGHLRVAQRRELIGTLAAGVAHDLGNLLGAVGANLEIAQDAGFPESARTHSLEQAATALRRGQGFLHSLLTIGRPEVEGDPGPIELGGLLRDSASLLEPLLGRLITLQVNLPPEPLWIRGDRLQLEQVLLNLAVNGRDAMPQGGALTLEVNRGLDGRPFLSVTDEGQGIPANMRDQLFLPFFTTKRPNEGSGLGLAMVQGIARAHGTEVELDSEMGKGSRFILRFAPANPPPPGP